MTKETRYLGDGVYATFDGYGITLDLRAQDNTTRIYLEPEVLGELMRYKDDLIAKAMRSTEVEATKRGDTS